MSYIRSGSNPEGLYIFHDGTNIEFIQADQDKIKLMPPDTFKGIMAKYLESSIASGDIDEVAEYGGAKLARVVWTKMMHDLIRGEN